MNLTYADNLLTSQNLKKMKITMIIVLLWISQVSLGQNNITDNKSMHTISNEALKNDQYNIKVTDSSKGYLSQPKADTTTENTNSYTAKNWRKTKKQIRRNKRRFLSNQSEHLNSKIMDTIYLDVPSSFRKSHISKL